MAYYMVKHGGAAYANRDLVKSIFNTGDAGLLRLIADGSIKQQCILDMFVYELKEEYISVASNMCSSVEWQDIDKVTEEFFSVSYANPDTCTIVEVQSSIKTYNLNGAEYIRVMDMQEGRKYRMLDTTACLTYLSKKYIALDMFVRGEKAPIVVTKRLQA
jgi:hypothetical protein